jgi:hypothetical protein
LRATKSNSLLQQYLKPPLKTNVLSAIERLHFALSPARPYAHGIFSHPPETKRDLPQDALLLAGIAMPYKLNSFPLQIAA